MSNQLTHDPPGVSPWRTRDFRLVWGGGFVNDVGDWLLLVALPVYVFIQSGSGSATAILFVVELVAALVLGPVGGSLVDRWDLRRTLVVTNLAQAVTLAPLLAVTGDRIWPAYLVVGAQALLTQINNPASVALLPRVVAPDQLTVANAANATSSSLARLIGSPLGGLAVGLGGIGTVVLIDGLSFLAVAVATALVRADTAPITSDVETGEDVTMGVRAGIRAVRAHRSLRSLILVDAFGQIAQGFFLVLFVVFVVRRLDGGGVDVGVIRGSMAVGAIVSAAVIGKFADRFGPITLLTAGYLGIGLFTAVQRFSPSGMLGRVAGMAGALDALARAAGSLLAGLLVSRVDLVVLVDTQSVIYLMCGVLAYMFIRTCCGPMTLIRELILLRLFAEPQFTGQNLRRDRNPDRQLPAGRRCRLRCAAGR